MPSNAMRVSCRRVCVGGENLAVIWDLAMRSYQLLPPRLPIGMRGLAGVYPLVGLTLDLRTSTSSVATSGTRVPCNNNFEQQIVRYFLPTRR
jgi:hypothetical protein